MLFQTALRRELTNLAGIVFAALFSITLTLTLVRLLGRAAGGKEASDIVLPLIAFQSLNFLPILLVLTLYISVMAALTRAWKDSEMSVWFASGLSLAAWVKPILKFSWPFVLATACLSLAVSPWAQRQTERFRTIAQQSQDQSKVSPGVFRDAGQQGDRVFFVEGMDEQSSRVGHVFVVSWDGARLTLVVASTGRLETSEDGGRFAILEGGHRYDGHFGQLSWRELQFGRYRIRLEDTTRRNPQQDSIRAMSTPQLLKEPDRLKLAELAWRIGLPLSCLILPLLALPLSSFNIRAGRSFNLLAALLLYVVYSNGISLTQAWIAQGKLSFALGFWPIHAIVLLVAVMLLRRRLVLRASLWSRLRSLFARRSATVRRSS